MLFRWGLIGYATRLPIEISAQSIMKIYFEGNEGFEKFRDYN